jgi:hypothetical protein
MQQNLYSYRGPSVSSSAYPGIRKNVGPLGERLVRAIPCRCTWRRFLKRATSHIYVSIITVVCCHNSATPAFFLALRPGHLPDYILPTTLAGPTLFPFSHSSSLNGNSKIGFHTCTRSWVWFHLVCLERSGKVPDEVSDSDPTNINSSHSSLSLVVHFTLTTPLSRARQNSQPYRSRQLSVAMTVL